MKETEMEIIILEIGGQEPRTVSQPKNPVIEVNGENKIYGSYFDGVTTKYFATEEEYKKDVPILPDPPVEPVDKYGYTEAYYIDLKAKLAATQEASTIEINQK